jgi:hypothetical protein
VKPTADASILTDTAMMEVKNLTKNYILIFGGVDKNTSWKGLTQTVNILRRNWHTNYIVINVPHRFDQNKKSCTDEEVKGYNRKRITKKSDNALLIYVVCDRQLFTKHGVHTNVEGKEIMISKLIDVLPMILDGYKASKLIPCM